MTVARSPSDAKPGRARPAVLLVALLAYSTVGISLDLLLVGFAGYLLGESILLYSVMIGLFLFSMGLGAHWSRRLGDPPTDAFVRVGIALAVVGTAAPLVVLAAGGERVHYQLTLAVMTALCGGLLGMAIPLCTRLLAGNAALSRLLGTVLALDYAGALLGSLLLPLVLLPPLGYLRSAALLGGGALLAAGVSWLALRPSLRAPAAGLALLLVAAAAAAAAYLGGPEVFRWAFTRATGETIVEARRSPYQEILLSEKQGALVLRLNGKVQVGEKWERSYHEALVHPAFALASSPRAKILVLGGGDGLALREILKYPSVKRVVLVDLDPEMVALARRHPRLRAWNGGSLDDPRVRVVHEDAFNFVRRKGLRFDVVVVDLPGPASLSLSKLYTVAFYRNVRRLLAAGGTIAVQSTAFDLSRARILWCISRTLEEAGLQVKPYVTGEMGFNLAARRPFDPAQIRLGVPTLYLTDPFARAMFQIPGDLGPLPVETNRIESHAILGYVR